MLDKDGTVNLANHASLLIIKRLYKIWLIFSKKHFKPSLTGNLMFVSDLENIAKKGFC
jgi:hypothetical protein